MPKPTKSLEDKFLNIPSHEGAIKADGKLKPEQKIEIGDIVVFHSDHSRKVDYPALVQEVFEGGRLRLWIFSVMSAYQQEALEGAGPNRWSRKKPRQ